MSRVREDVSGAKSLLQKVLVNKWVDKTKRVALERKF